MTATATARPRPANLFDVYQCEFPLTRHPGKTRTGYKAVRLDVCWEPIGPVPTAKVNWVRRVIADRKGDAIKKARLQSQGKG